MNLSITAKRTAAYWGDRFFEACLLYTSCKCIKLHQNDGYMREKRALFAYFG